MIKNLNLIIDGSIFEHNTNQDKINSVNYYMTLQYLEYKYNYIKNTVFFTFKNGGNKAEKIT
jgi:hypothetical protein